MSKPRQTLKLRIPPYRHPRNKWRRAIHTAVTKEVKERGVSYKLTDRLQLIITLYMTDKELHWHDVDNRLKDIMDALQGRVGGSKAKHLLTAIVPNDDGIG